MLQPAPPPGSEGSLYLSILPWPFSLRLGLLSCFLIPLRMNCNHNGLYTLPLLLMRACHLPLGALIRAHFTDGAYAVQACGGEVIWSQRASQELIERGSNAGLSALCLFFPCRDFSAVLFWCLPPSPA